jgi:hypothetical protein
MRSSHILGALLLTFSSLAAAWGEPQQIRRDLLPRATPTAGEGDAIVGDQSSTADASTTTSTSKNSKSSGKSGSKSGSSAKTTSIPSTALQGSISLMTPAATDGYMLYKIGDVLTWVWNYTDVIIEPTAINVVAYCSEASADFTITQNASWPITAATWDTGEYQSTATAKLLVATYTLNIWDASKQRTAAATAGYLYGYSSWTFGLYTPQSYVPLADFVCPTCDSGASTLDSYTMRMMLGMALVAATSFTWFVAGRII